MKSCARFSFFKFLPFYFIPSYVYPMIRKRRSSILPTLDERMDPAEDRAACDEFKRRIHKLKQVPHPQYYRCNARFDCMFLLLPKSPFPFPEGQECCDKENAYPDVGEIKRSLSFASEAPSPLADLALHACPEPTIKPSDILELQRQLKECSPLVTKQQPKGQREQSEGVTIPQQSKQPSNGS